MKNNEKYLGYVSEEVKTKINIDMLFILQFYKNEREKYFIFSTLQMN